MMCTKKIWTTTKIHTKDTKTIQKCPNNSIGEQSTTLSHKDKKRYKTSMPNVMSTL